MKNGFKKGRNPFFYRAGFIKGGEKMKKEIRKKFKSRNPFFYRAGFILGIVYGGHWEVCKKSQSLFL